MKILITNGKRMICNSSKQSWQGLLASFAAAPCDWVYSATRQTGKQTEEQRLRHIFKVGECLWVVKRERAIWDDLYRQSRAILIGKGWLRILVQDRKRRRVIHSYEASTKVRKRRLLRPQDTRVKSNSHF